MKKRLIIPMMVPCLILLSGCSPPEENATVQESPRMVRIETVARHHLPINVNAVGRLIPNREVVISSQIAGIVMAYKADVGSEVSTGDSLVQLDPTDYGLVLDQARANLLSAQANLAVAKKSFQRTKQLLPEKVITPETYEKSEAQYKAYRASAVQLETAVNMAQRQLDKTNINAPFGGFITSRFVELGQNIGVGEPVMAMADMKTMRIRIHLNERDYVHLGKDDPVRVKIEAYSETSFPGKVDKIGIKADPQTNTFEVEILIKNPGNRLKAGLTARVFIRTDILRDAIMIPQNCVLFREDRKEVFIVEKDNTAAVREITLGRTQGSAVMILEGLVPGDSLVITGSQYLKPGDKVTVAP
jgi:RND family efflux transporter MFP subunit